MDHFNQLETRAQDRIRRLIDSIASLTLPEMYAFGELIPYRAGIPWQAIQEGAKRSAPDAQAAE